MCTDCGCSDSEVLTQRLAPLLPNTQPITEHPIRLIPVMENLLDKNNRLAVKNRQLWQTHRQFVLNLVSSPGSGKTTLLVRSIELLQRQIPITVIEGDQQTQLDAERIRKTGAPVVQINTGKACHLDAQMVANAYQQLSPATNGVLLIENVGNLVCPAGFDLGEHHKVVILSVTEGEDKPLKYPDMFAAADVMLLTKTDLLPALDFDTELCSQYALQVNPRLRILNVSARSGQGMDTWLDWLIKGYHATIRSSF